MMNKELYDQLVNEGIDEAKAEQIAKSFGIPEEVDADRLAKALEGLRESMEQPTNGADVDFSTPNPVTDSDDVIGAITKGADAILIQSREHIEARAEDQTAIIERLDAMAKSILAIGETLERRDGELADGLNKGLSTVAEQLAQPNAPRSVQAEMIPTPGDVTAAGEMSRPDAISKALNEMRNTQDWNRKSSLGQAVSLLESGENVATVVTNYNLSTAS